MGMEATMEAVATGASAPLMLSPRLLLNTTTPPMDTTGTTASALLMLSPRQLLHPTMAMEAMEAMEAMATTASAPLSPRLLLNTTMPTPSTDTTMVKDYS